MSLACSLYLWLGLNSWLIKISKYFHMDWCLISDFPITVIIISGNPGPRIDVETVWGKAVFIEQEQW